MKNYALPTSPSPLESEETEAEVILRRGSDGGFSSCIYQGQRKKAPHIFKFPLLDARVRSIRQAQPYFRHANNIH